MIENLEEKLFCEIKKISFFAGRITKKRIKGRVFEIGFVTHNPEHHNKINENSNYIEIVKPLETDAIKRKAVDLCRTMELQYARSHGNFNHWRSYSLWLEQNKEAVIKKKQPRVYCKIVVVKTYQDDAGIDVHSCVFKFGFESLKKRKNKA